MFNRKKTNTYQYGSNPKYTIKLTEAEAYATNNIRIYDYDETTGMAKVNSDEIDMDAYNTAAIKLNAYIKRHGGSIPCTDEWLESNEILTLIK